VLATINAHTADTGIRATATGADGEGTGSYLTLATISYGSGATVSAVSSRSNASGVSAGIGTVSVAPDTPSGETGSGTGHAGLDVAGTINGEAATGAGQILIGDEGNATTDGLRLRITASEAGSLGTIQLFAGIASAAQRALERITDVVDGTLHGERESLEQRIDAIQETIDAREEAALRREEMLRLKFNQLESALSQFQSQSAYLSSQLSALR
jgi:flagellar hook-associated protein 2